MNKESNLKKYKNSFIEVFQIKEKELETLEYQSIPDWDSVGHMSLISALEEGFNIMMEMDDIVDFNSYKKGKELLLKYNIKF